MNFSEASPGPKASRDESNGAHELNEAALADLGVRFRRKEPGAFEQAFHLYKEAVHVIGILELGDPDEAQDLVQETFRRAWSSAATLADASRLRSWLFAIARNLCIDLSKRAQNRPLAVPEVADWWLTEASRDLPQERVIRGEKAQRVRELLQKVPSSFRMVLALRILEEKSYQEISATLGIPLHGVKNAVARGGRILIEKIRNTPDLDTEGER